MKHRSTVLRQQKQIAGLMDFFKTPYIFVGNKVTSKEDRDYITQHLGIEPTFFLSEDVSVKRNPSVLVTAWNGMLEKNSYKACRFEPK